MAKETSAPVISWVALGMKGAGDWSDNREYVAYVHSLPTKAEKTEYALQYIWDNRRDFWDISHLVKKIRCNFASGHLRTGKYTYTALKEHNPIWEIPAAKAIADPSLMGIIIFLMIWEANNRQLYNQVPVILPGAIMNVRIICFESMDT